MISTGYYVFIVVSDVVTKTPELKHEGEGSFLVLVLDQHVVVIQRSWLNGLQQIGFHPLLGQLACH